MKKILILFLFTTMLISCQEEPQPEIIDVGQIKAELDEYIKNRDATRSDNSLYEDIINFLKEKGFEEVEYNSSVESSSGRLNCTIIDHAFLMINNDCFVQVIAYGGGCGNSSGCVGNRWNCGNDTDWEEVYYC